MKNYLKTYNELAKFIQPITEKHCSPCQHNRGPYGCCSEGSFFLTNIDKKLNSITSFKPKLGQPCRFLKNGCSLKHKPDICLIYLCGAIFKTLTINQQNTYWRLRNKLSNSFGRVLKIKALKKNR